MTQRITVQVPVIGGGFAGVAVRNFDSLGRGRTTIRVGDYTKDGGAVLGSSSLS